MGGVGMNAQQLQEIKARAEAATPGPWYWDTNRRFQSCMLKAPHDGGTCVVDFVRWGTQRAQPRFNDTATLFGGILRTMEEYDAQELPNHNAIFIAHAREDIPALVAEVERLREVLRQYADIYNWRGIRTENMGVVQAWDGDTSDPRKLAVDALYGGDE